MNKEDKELLFTFLSLIVRYKIICKVEYFHELTRPPHKCLKGDYELRGIRDDFLNFRFDLVHIDDIDCIKPYVRSLSSLTEKEKEEYNQHISSITTPIDAVNFTIWCCKHHLDIFHLIEKGLGIEAPEGMYDLND